MKKKTLKRDFWRYAALKIPNIKKIQNKFSKSARRPLRSQYQNNKFIIYRMFSVKINQI